MTHFVVIVRIPESRSAEDRDIVLREMLATYQENNSNDCPREYLEFHDETDEYLKEYEGTITMVAHKGEILYPWNEAFRVQGTFGTTFGGDSPSHVVPDGSPRIEVPFKLIYQTFDDFATGYAGLRKDSETGRYGYWENPNKKWDWYVVGGRWPGMIPSVSDGPCDSCLVCDIDRDAVFAQQTERINEFLAEWTRFREGGTFRDFEGPREDALKLGLVTVITGRDPVNGEMSRRWNHRSKWWDLLSPMSDDEIRAKYSDYFCPIRAYSVLDSEGWHSPGEMGWFGCSSDTPESYIEWLAERKRRIFDGNPNDVIVSVDCHI